MDASALDGLVLKGYEIRERIGAGAFGAVYRAYQTSIGREVAIKVIRPEYANQPDFVRQFEVEAQMIARLEHPHIVPLYDYWRDPTGAFLVMRWLRESLRSPRDGESWKLAEIAHLLDQVASALTLAHRDSVVHCDIRPSNILLDEDANAYLADFGIARNIHLRQSAYSEGSAFESYAEYASPEQIRAEPVSNRTDIYSLGYVIYELITGVKAFSEAKGPVDYAQKHLTAALPSVSAGRANIPAAVDEVLQTATAKDPSRRYPTALRFAAAFRAAIPPVLPGSFWQPLAEPLTARELEVLNLMIDDRSVTEVANQLVLSSGTVRWYIKQIYRKLDVNNRQQAVNRALGLKLNQPPVIVSRLETTGSEAAPVVELPPPGLEPENPYKGLQAFQESDAEDFFGRAGLTEQLLSRLSEDGDASRFLVIVGPSGSGKSSVVRAGLIPALRKGALASTPTPFIASFLPGAHPLEELEVALLRVSVNPLPGLFSQLSEDRRGLVRAAKRLLPPSPKTELILVIDQFEEVFTLVEDEAVRTHFIDNLLSAVTDPRSRVRVILTLRADFFDRPLMFPRLAELVRANSEVVVPLSAREMEQAITAPVERIGLRLEAGLAATIVDDVGEQPGTLPLLQYALTELFEQREGHVLTLDGYKATGGVSGALVKRADQLFESFDPSAQAMTRQLFLRLIALGEGTEDTRRRVLMSEVVELDQDGRIEEAINAYTQHRLLTLDHDPLTRGPTVEIAHEALIREWVRLREWLVASREDVRVQRRLAYMAEEWRRSDGETSFLAHGAQLVQFDAWAAETEIVLSSRERGFLEASLAQRQHEREAETERQAREQKLERRSKVRLYGLVAALAIGLVLALILGGAAIFQSNVAAANASRAEANFQNSEALRLAAAASALLPGNINDHQTAALLAIRSLEVQYSPQADAALSQATQALHTAHYFPGVPGFISKSRFSPDQQLLAVEASDSSIQIWDANDWTLLQTLNGHTEPFFYMDWSPNNEMLVSSSFDGTTRIWDVRTGEEIKQFPDAYWRMHFSPDNSRLAMTLTREYTPIIWDLAAGEAVPLSPLVEEIGLVIDIRFSADGQSIMFVDYMGDVQVLDVELQETLQAFNCTLFWDMILSGDGRMLMCPDRATGQVNFWDTANWEIAQSVESEASRPLAFSPDDSVAAVGSDAGRVQILDLVAGTVLREWTAGEGAVLFASFLPDGQSLLTGSQDRTARLWDIQTGRELRRYSGFGETRVQGISADGMLALINSHHGTHLVDTNIAREPRAFLGSDLSSLMYSPDGSRILIGDAGSVYLWDVASESIVREFSSEDSGTEGLYWPVFSPDGHKVLTGGMGEGVRLWNADSGELEQVLAGPLAIWYPAYAPDGNHVAAANDLGDIIIWDLTSDQRLHILAGHTGSAPAIYSPDGLLLASFDETGKIHLWDPVSGELQQTIDAAVGLNSISFSPDSRYLAFVGNPSTSQVWDLERNEPIPGFPRLAGAYSTVFSGDGQRVFVGLADGTVHVIDLATGAELRTLKPHSGYVWLLALSPDGRTIASGSSDGSVRISDVEISGLIDYACSRLLWDLSPEQRAEFGIRDDAPTCYRPSR